MDKEVGGILVIGPSMVPTWKAIEQFLLDNPMGWFPVSGLATVFVDPDVQPQSVKNVIHRASRNGVLRSEGVKGKRKYRLADEYTVAVFLSGRKI